MQEVISMIVASLLALGLILYLILLVRSISQKASLVFGPDELTISEAESLQFKKYDALMEKLYPGSTTVLSTYGIKTPSSTTPIIATTTTSTVSAVQPVTASSTPGESSR